MTKSEYLDMLKEKLSAIDKDVAKSLFEDFEAHFKDGENEGRSEEEIISHLGNIDEIVEALSSETAQIKNQTESEESPKKVNHVVIDAKFADVTLVPSLNEKIEVSMINKGSLLSKFTQTMVGEQRGDVFEVRVLPLISGNNRADMHISVSLPSHLLSVKVSSTSGDLTFTGIDIQGACTISSASGDIDVSRCEAGALEISSADGDIVIRQSKADVSVHCASGDVTVKEGRGSSLLCVTASGDVTVDGIYQSVTVKTASGDQIHNIKGLDKMSLSTVDGDGKITFSDTDSVMLKFSTISGECVINQGQKSQLIERNEELVINEGRIRCMISTVSGQFTINMG